MVEISITVPKIPNSWAEKRSRQNCLNVIFKGPTTRWRKSTLLSQTSQYSSSNTIELINVVQKCLRYRETHQPPQIICAENVTFFRFLEVSAFRILHCFRREIVRIFVLYLSRKGFRKRKSRVWQVVAVAVSTHDLVIIPLQQARIFRRSSSQTWNDKHVFKLWELWTIRRITRSAFCSMKTFMRQPEPDMEPDTDSFISITVSANDVVGISKTRLVAGGYF